MCLPHRGSERGTEGAGHFAHEAESLASCHEQRCSLTHNWLELLLARASRARALREAHLGAICVRLARARQKRSYVYGARGRSGLGLCAFQFSLCKRPVACHNRESHTGTDGHCCLSSSSPSPCCNYYCYYHCGCRCCCFIFSPISLLVSSKQHTTPPALTLSCQH